MSGREVMGQSTQARQGRRMQALYVRRASSRQRAARVELAAIAVVWIIFLLFF